MLQELQKRFNNCHLLSQCVSLAQKFRDEIREFQKNFSNRHATSKELHSYLLLLLKADLLSELMFLLSSGSELDKCAAGILLNSEWCFVIDPQDKHPMLVLPQELVDLGWRSDKVKVVENKYVISLSDF